MIAFFVAKTHFNISVILSFRKHKYFNTLIFSKLHSILYEAKEFSSLLKFQKTTKTRYTMQKILLVEPSYKNKYPPMSLMKLATYHRAKGDIVEFYKGKAPYSKIAEVDKIYITTLFTFYYDLTVDTINHYSSFKDKSCIFIGGIAAMLMPDKFREDTKIDNIITTQLTSSNMLGFNDDVNIDELSLDYDILDDIDYKYPAGDNYFAYTSRGCPRKCKFCGVKVLEPNFITTNNIVSQIQKIDETYGVKRNLLLMDNNILYSDKLKEIVQDILSLGFTKDSRFTHPNIFTVLMNKIKKRQALNSDITLQLTELDNMLSFMSNRVRNFKFVHKEYSDLIKSIKISKNFLGAVEKNHQNLTEIFEKYRSFSQLPRYVDFNQGIDARLVTNENMKIISQLPIYPFRLAYDSIKETKIYTKSFKIAVKNGITSFSNYILYNWEDTPEDLWNRLHNAAILYNQAGPKVRGFSFPMKYAPIYSTDRTFIGKHWNKKYLTSLNIIINVTKGIVAQELDFFYKAFGESTEEFLKILIMPNEFIKFRSFFEYNKLTVFWEKLYNSFDENEKNDILKILGLSIAEQNRLTPKLDSKTSLFISLYHITKKQIVKGILDTDRIKEEILDALDEKYQKKSGTQAIDYVQMSLFKI